MNEVPAHERISKLSISDVFLLRDGRFNQKTDLTTQIFIDDHFQLWNSRIHVILYK